MVVRQNTHTKVHSAETTDQYFDFTKQTDLIQQSGDRWKGLFKAKYNLLFNYGEYVELKEIRAISLK